MLFNKQHKSPKQLLRGSSRYRLCNYQIELAEEAILGQRSAASLATGPVIPDPFISPLGFTITPALSSSHSIPRKSTFKVEIHSILSSPTLSLSHHNSRHDYIFNNPTETTYPSYGVRAFPSSRRQ